jgi:glycosyltransferase involved in cell wall biosynthesis
VRILHVVTLVDRQASYGGPLTVALGHCAELRRRGHEPLLVSGWRGPGRPPSLLEGVPVRLFPVRPVVPGMRYAGLYSAAMHAWFRRHAKAFDVAHLHLARDLVPLTAAAELRRVGVPYVTQTHGMIRPDLRRSVRFIDRSLTVPSLRAADRVLSLTPMEDEDLVQVAGDGRSPTRLRNGIAVRLADVARTGSGSQLLDAVFLARLHPRKRVMAFARAAQALVAEGVPARFAVIGPDDGDLSALRHFIASRPRLDGRLTYEGALPHEKALERLRRADVYVLPSVNEPYPMTLLEACAAGVAVVCTSSCGLASQLRDARAAEVVEPTEESLAAGMRRVLTDTAHRQRLAAHARLAAASTFSMQAVVDDLEGYYATAGTTSAGRGAR